MFRAGDSLLARSRDGEPTRDPLEELGERYVEGERSQAQLEREIERELADGTDHESESESVRDAERRSEHDRS